MDQYNDIDKATFIKYFLTDLHCRKELIQYTYPNEYFEEGKAIKDHISRCKENLKTFIEEAVKKSASRKMNDIHIRQLADDKLDELMASLEPKISKYSEDIVVVYIKL